MPGSSLSKSSISRALQQVDKADIGSLVNFVERLEVLVITESSRLRVVQATEISEPEVFKLFKLINPYEELGPLRSYITSEIKAVPSTPTQSLTPEATRLLHSIAQIWPPYNESNLRMFVSLMIHFAIEELNASNERANPSEEQDTNATKRPAITLKGYTKVLVTSRQKDGNDQEVLVQGVIDYGVSYAQRTPEALETFFAVVEAKAQGELSGQAWPQLLCYMGTFNIPFYSELLTWVVSYHTPASNDGRKDQLCSVWLHDGRQELSICKNQQQRRSK